MPKTGLVGQSSFPGYTHVHTKKGISEYVLKKNGLRVLFMRTKGTGTVTTNMVYLVGSRHEQRGETGVTHMLEHMMFKPTGEHGVADKELGWKKLENYGALMNATTWVDRTHYYFTLPCEYLGEMLAVEARRMRNIMLEDHTFQPERASVLSEYEMYAGEPLSLLEAEVVGAAYVSHGYGHDTIGHKPDIRGYTVDMLTRYHDTFYWPNNACLIVVGDTTKEQVLTEVKRTFGVIPRSTHPIPETVVREPTQRGARRVSVQKQGQVSILSLNYKNVPATHPDWAALYLLLEYLADGKTSVLHKQLVDTHKASSVCSYQFPTHDPFLCGVIVYLTQNTTHDSVEKLVRESIEKCKRTRISKKHLSEIKNAVLASELFARDGGHAIATALTEFVAMGDWTRYFSLITEIERVECADLKRVARTYFVPEGETAGVFVATKK